MKTREEGKATIGIAMAAIMLASVFAATVPIISAESRGDNFNHIVKQTEPQKVLIGQNLQFEGFDVPPTVYRFVDDDVENIYTSCVADFLTIGTNFKKFVFVYLERKSQITSTQLSPYRACGVVGRVHENRS